MSDSSTPSFDAWVEYCFTGGYHDFHAGHGSPERCEYERWTEGLEPPTLAEFVVRLFRSPAFIADRYTDDQIADATWFLFGCASGYFHVLRSDAVPRSLQIEYTASVATLYTELFDRVCCKRGANPDGDYTNDLKVDTAVYMIWDMDCIEGAVMFPESSPHLVEPSFGVLDTVLARCCTSSCQVSALHALGHIHPYHPQRAERMIDAFIASRSVAQWVRNYAEQARRGHVL